MISLGVIHLGDVYGEFFAFLKDAYSVKSDPTFESITMTRKLNVG